jgi:predicted nucleic acid-binding protein
LRAEKRRRPRGLVDTFVLVAGIAGLKSLEITPKNPSVKLLQDWIEGDTFVWLVSDEILLEYKRILGRLGVRRPLIGKIINLLREAAELVPASALPNISPDPADDPFCACAETGRADFRCDAESKRFPAIALISSRDQTRRARSNNSPPETTPPVFAPPKKGDISSERRNAAREQRSWRLQIVTGCQFRFTSSARHHMK